VGHFSGVQVRGEGGRAVQHQPNDDYGKLKDSKELSIVKLK